MQQKTSAFDKAYAAAKNMQRNHLGSVMLDAIPKHDYAKRLAAEMAKPHWLRNQDIMRNQTQYCAVYRIIAEESVISAQYDARLPEQAFLFFLKGYKGALKEETAPFCMFDIKSHFNSDKHLRHYFECNSDAELFSGAGAFFSSMARQIILLQSEWLGMMDSMLLRDIDQPMHVIAHAISALQAVNAAFVSEVGRLAKASVKM